MITEYNYIDLLKNCSKWNERTCRERKSRFRYPFYDHQTGTAHRPVQNYYKVKEQQHNSQDPTVFIQYSASRWKKRDHQPSDAIEMKMFLRDNPQLDAAVNQTAQVSLNIPEVSVTDVSMDIGMNSKGTPKQNAFDDYTDDLDDEMSNGSGSDEDDWGSKRKKGKNASAKKKKASGTVRPRESHACSKCIAKFKSLAGLTYHSAFVHGEFNSTPLKLMSPNLEVSDYCDLCLGGREMNKETRRAEDLVSCHDCGRSGHPSCLKFSKNVPFIINRYGWQCIECKSCTICGTSENDAMLLFCDDCDRGYHTYCLRPPLKSAPEGEYSCDLCLRQFGPNASAPR